MIDFVFFLWLFVKILSGLSIALSYGVCYECVGFASLA